MKTTNHHRQSVDYSRNTAAHAHSAPMKGRPARGEPKSTAPALSWHVVMALFLKIQEEPPKALSGRVTTHS